MKKNPPRAPSVGANSRGEPPSPTYRFSGHETFPFRYSWFPKAISELAENAELFSNEEHAMVRLGVGKNMVRAIRFWIQAASLVAPKERGLCITEFGNEILAETSGHDPYLEDIRTLWLIHWKISSNSTEPLFAWEYLLNRWQRPDIVRSEVLIQFRQEVGRMGKDLSDVTLAQHFDTFLHTYVPTRSPKGEVKEENLDSPLIELDLIRRVGERRSAEGGRVEAVYGFNRDSKPSVTSDLLAYCINDYWDARAHFEETLSFRDIAVKTGSVGQVFKLPEADIRERLLSIEEDTDGYFVYRESAAGSQLTRDRKAGSSLLGAVYRQESAYV